MTPSRTTLGVKVRGVYPGVDLVYYGDQRRLEYDLMVAPGGDPGVIRAGVLGGRAIALDARGNLVLSTAGARGQRAPVLYQEAGGVRLPSRPFRSEGAGQIGFAVGDV